MRIFSDIYLAEKIFYDKNYIMMLDNVEINKIEIPIPIPALRNVNSYIISIDDELVLIDTGMPLKSSLNTLINGVRSYGFNVNRIKYIFITHLHIDHIGGASYIRNLTGSKTIIHRGEKEFIEKFADVSKIFLNFYKEIMYKNGVPVDLINEFMKFLPSFAYKDVYISGKYDILVEDGDIIKIFNHELKVIHTPGHSPHHICILLDNKILFTGDHVLPKITPNIRFPFSDEDPLNEYLYSLDKIIKLGINLYYPGHGDISNSLIKRITQLKCHHLNRLKEVLDILHDNELSVYEVASRINWDVKLPWEEFPAIQKYFAIGEAYSHINYLKYRGFLLKTVDEGILKYRFTGEVDNAIRNIKEKLCKND